MLDYSVFDSLIDATFVVDESGKIAYCNDAGATFCQTSVRRVVGKLMLSDIFAVSEPDIFPFTPTSQGYDSPTPLIETEYTLPKGDKAGKVQLSVRMINAGNWIFFIHDVTLEEALHSKYRSELMQKEEYARNLEKLVEARTAELHKVNQTLNAILDSLGQGFFTFAADGRCGDVFTKACEDILQGVPNSRKAWEVLDVPSKEIEQFKTWMDSSFTEVLPFEDLKNLGPSLFPHRNGRRVVLEYYPIRRAQKAITDIVVVATDKTAEFQAQAALEVERHYAAMIVKFVKNRDQFLQFLASVRLTIQQLFTLAAQPIDSESYAESFRVLHTLEGEAGTFSLRELRQLSRDSQQVLEPFKASPALPADGQKSYVATLTVMKEKYEEFLVENQGIFGVSNGEAPRMVELPFANLETYMEHLQKYDASEALRSSFNDLFLKVPIDSRLKYFDGLMQAVAESLNKKVKPLMIEGGDLRIFPEPYAKFFSSLVHAFRNAVDHGLEDPLEREWAGKDPAGLVRVEVTRAAGVLHMKITDDGKGIDPAMIRKKVAEKFPTRDCTKMSDEEVIQAVLWAGFSSRDTIGEFSGRGVGLDALYEEVLSIGGTLHLRSKVGQGTVLEISVPDLGTEMAFRRSA